VHGLAGDLNSKAMPDYTDTMPAPPSPDTDTPPSKTPQGDPHRGPAKEPWREPHEPPKKVNLPAEPPTPAIIIPPPANPMIS
jgi:hypothetical protein